jgi:chromosome segregation ATPase
MCKNILKAIETKGYRREFDLVFKDQSIASALSVILEELRDLHNRITHTHDTIGATNALVESHEKDLGRLIETIRTLQNKVNGTLAAISPCLLEILQKLELMEARGEELAELAEVVKKAIDDEEDE